MHVAALSQLSCHNRHRRSKKDTTLNRIWYCMDKFIRKLGDAHKYEHKTNQHLQGDHCLDTFFSHRKPSRNTIVSGRVGVIHPGTTGSPSKLCSIYSMVSMITQLHASS